MTKCEGCRKKLEEGYSIVVILCHECRVELEDWLKRRNRQR